MSLFCGTHPSLSTYRDISNALVEEVAPLGKFSDTELSLDQLPLEARTFSFQMLSTSQIARPFDCPEQWAWFETMPSLSPLESSPFQALHMPHLNRCGQVMQAPSESRVSKYAPAPGTKKLKILENMLPLIAPGVHKKPTQNRPHSSETAPSPALT
jgi:hypothetical protein